jgi:hypothetical protein
MASLSICLSYDDDTGTCTRSEMPLDVVYTPFQGRRSDQTENLTTPYRPSYFFVLIEVDNKNCPSDVPSKVEDADQCGQV